MALGAVCVVLPLLAVSAWLVPLVWTGFILLLEPLNYRRGPYLGDVKVFEMPVLGYLGFPPFALEYYAMYHALRGALGRLPAPLLCGV